MPSIWKSLAEIGSVSAGPPEAAVGAALVGRLLHGAVAVGARQDEGPGPVFLAEIDDWCSRGWPQSWPRPKPRGWDQGLIFTGAALYAAHLGSHYGHDSEMQQVLGSAAERLMHQVG